MPSLERPSPAVENQIAKGKRSRNMTREVRANPIALLKGKRHLAHVLAGLRTGTILGVVCSDVPQAVSGHCSQSSWRYQAFLTANRLWRIHTGRVSDGGLGFAYERHNVVDPNTIKFERINGQLELNS